MKRVALDIESYPNYLLIAFKAIGNDKVVTFEIKGESNSLDNEQRNKLSKLLSSYVTFGFNSLNYDIPLILLALRGDTAKAICEAGNRIIEDNLPHWKSYDVFGIELPSKFSHYDISEVARGVRVSLKLYGGRINAPTLQDLPIEPNTTLTDEQMNAIKEYNVNDLDTTILLHENIKGDIELRENLSEIYGIDLRSKSDAQIAEAIIVKQVSALKKSVVAKMNYPDDLKVKYKLPDFIEFSTEKLQDLVSLIVNHDFEIDGRGSIVLPDSLSKTKIKIGGSEYQIGVGGLHSTEKSQVVTADEDYLIDSDVTSYYPSIINTLNLHPKNMGSKFNEVYLNIFNERVKAKARMKELAKENNFGEEYQKAEVTQAAFKIVLNSSFGKFGSKYSKMYSPQLLIQVTLTGQLALLMLIEKCELAGIKVVSANTDGFVSKIPKHLLGTYTKICSEWSQMTGFNLEETYYTGLYSRDVNNYFAVTTDGKVKGKGVFASSGIAKNPQLPIVSEAVKNYIISGKPFIDTLKSCSDISEFISVRSVTGGAVFGNEYLGRVVRWVYTTDGGVITYKKNGNRVPKSDGSKPFQTLPSQLPSEIDYDRYVKECENLYSTVVR